MEKFSKLRRKVMSLTIVICALTVGLSGIANAQLDNPEIKSTKEPATGSNKPADKNNSTTKGKTVEKKRLKQRSGKKEQDYEGAQPPQGGRLGQGFE